MLKVWINALFTFVFFQEDIHRKDLGDDLNVADDTEG